MIAFVRGRVADVGLASVVVDVGDGQGGVGLEVICTPGTLAGLRPGEAAELPTSMVVREDSLTLFGFADADEKQCFELLQTASGVGPKLAQAMLAVLAPEELRRAVTEEDVKTLTRVPGIGQKGAQRIILELRDRLGAPLVSGASSGATGRAAQVGAPGAGWRDQVQEGLVGLGWSAKEAGRAIERVADQAPAGPDARPDVAALLRAALQTLSRA